MALFSSLADNEGELVTFPCHDAWRPSLAGEPFPRFSLPGCEPKSCRPRPAKVEGAEAANGQPLVRLRPGRREGGGASATGAKIITSPSPPSALLAARLRRPSCPPGLARPEARAGCSGNLLFLPPALEAMLEKGK